jgi:hypothetical protein
MNPDQNLQYLAFFRVEYPLDMVRNWLKLGIDCFVFDAYFPATEDPNRPIVPMCSIRIRVRSCCCAAR